MNFNISNRSELPQPSEISGSHQILKKAKKDPHPVTKVVLAALDLSQNQYPSLELLPQEIFSFHLFPLLSYEDCVTISRLNKALHVKADGLFYLKSREAGFEPSDEKNVDKHLEAKKYLKKLGEELKSPELVPLATLLYLETAHFEEAIEGLGNLSTDTIKKIFDHPNPLIYQFPCVLQCILKRNGEKPQELTNGKATTFSQSAYAAALNHQNLEVVALLLRHQIMFSNYEKIDDKTFEEMPNHRILEPYSQTLATEEKLVNFLQLIVLLDEPGFPLMNLFWPLVKNNKSFVLQLVYFAICYGNTSFVQKILSTEFFKDKTGLPSLLQEENSQKSREIKEKMITYLFMLSDPNWGLFFIEPVWIETFEGILGNNLLHHAVEKGRQDMIELLMGSGYSANQVGYQRCLIKKANLKFFRHCQPLHYAIYARQEKTALYLIKQNADVNAESQDEEGGFHTPLSLAIDYHLSDSFVQTLLDRGAACPVNFWIKASKHNCRPVLNYICKHFTSDEIGKS